MYCGYQSVLLAEIQDQSLKTFMVMETSIYSSRALRLLQLDQRVLDQPNTFSIECIIRYVL